MIVAHAGSESLWMGSLRAAKTPVLILKSGPTENDLGEESLTGMLGLAEVPGDR